MGRDASHEPEVLPQSRVRHAHEPPPRLTPLRAGALWSGALPPPSGLPVRRALSLRTRLTAVFAACLLFVVGTMAWAERRQHQARQDDVRAAAQREAVLLAGELTRLVEGVEQLLHAVAVAPVARLRDAPECDRYLEQLQQAAHGSAALGITDAGGRVTCLSRRVSAQQLDAHDRYYFTETMRRNALVTGVYAVGRAAGAKAVHFGYPVQDAKGRAQGVAFAPLNLDWLARQLSDRRLPGHATLTVADHRGTVLVRLPEMRLAGQALPAPWRALMDRPAAGTEELPGIGGGGPQLVGYVPLGQGPQGLFVAVGLTSEHALGPGQRAHERALWLAAGAALLAVVLAWLLVERFVHRPLERLLVLAGALRRGEASPRAADEPPEGSEFRRLALELQALGETLQQREAALRAARDRAEAASRSLADLLAVAGHDLRQPVQSMVLSAALLGHKLQGRPEAPAAQRLQRSARHLVAMIDGLLSVSQLDAGRITPELRVFPLGELVEGVVEEFAQGAALGGLALQCEGGPPLWVRSDPALLRRVLVNCVGNAVKYTPAGGRVGVAWRALEGGAEAEVRIADTGVGIAPEQQARVWEPFRQLGNAERDLDKGLGLGLAIVRRIAALLGHGVALQSRPGRGTVVTLRLACGTPALAGVPDDSAALAPLGGRLLLVDGDEAVVASTAELLEALGVEVVACTSAEQAMARLHGARQPFDAVLAEHRLPAQSGLEVLRAARARWPAVHAVLTGGSLPAARRAECAAEGIAVLDKPFGERALHAALAPLHLSSQS